MRRLFPERAEWFDDFQSVLVTFSLISRSLAFRQLSACSASPPALDNNPVGFRRAGTWRHETPKVLAIRLAPAAIVAALSFSPSVEAEEAFTPYLSAFAGVGFTGDALFSGVVTPPGGEQTVDTSFDNGINFGVAIGAELGAFSLGFATPRVEMELSHLSNNADSIDFSGNGAGAENNVGGDVSRTLLLANLLLDIETGGPVSPMSASAPVSLSPMRTSSMAARSAPRRRSPSTTAASSSPAS